MDGSNGARLKYELLIFDWGESGRLAKHRFAPR
jgi:hypothetical protein